MQSLLYIAIAELNQYLPSFSDCAGPPRTEPPRFADFASERLRRTFTECVVDVAVPNLRFHLWRICALLHLRRHGLLLLA